MFDFLLGDDVRDETSEGAGRARRHRPAHRARHQRRQAARRARRRRARARRAEARHRSPHRVGRSRRRRRCSPTSTACATGELVYDLACVLGLGDHARRSRDRSTPAMLTDTGGFRFSNTIAALPRHRGASCWRAGVDPEEMYIADLRVGAGGSSAPAGDVLATLDVDEEHGLSWLSMQRRRAREVRRAGRKISTASSSTRGRSPERGWRCSSATSAMAR